MTRLPPGPIDDRPWHSHQCNARQHDTCGIPYACECKCHHVAGPLLRALEQQTGYVVVKALPPDGCIIRLEDGARWLVAAYRQAEEDQ